MDHQVFKKNQTAALYVSGGLDPQTQETFELHMMSCGECLDDVETWRALKTHMPRERKPMARGLKPRGSAAHAYGTGSGWKMAAAIAGIGLLGVLGGWYGHAWQAPGLDDDVAFFNMPPATRGFDCVPLRLAPNSKVVLIRVPGATPDLQLLARDLDARELPPRAYTTRVQADGSWLIRFERSATLERGIRLETRDNVERTYPLGCVASTPSG